MVCIKGPLLQRCAAYNYAFEEINIYHEEQFVRECKKFELHERDKYFTNRDKEVTVVQGEERLKKFENILFNEFSMKPHKFQRGFYFKAIAALAEFLVGEDDWKTIGPDIIKRRGWKEMSKLLLAKAPRRFGKSIAVGGIVIATALVKTGCTQSIFSTGRRASRNLLEICYKRLVDLGLSHRVTRFNQEELFIEDPFTGQISKIFCYPSNSKIDKKSDKRKKHPLCTTHIEYPFENKLYLLYTDYNSFK